MGQLIFDPNGDVFSCFEGAGNEKAKIGRYIPELEIEEDKLNKWNTLNSFSSDFCNKCKYKFVCAGGCPWHIIHQGKTECLPIEEEVNLAWNYYSTKVM